MTLLHIQNRIEHLKRNPVQNTNIIKKWLRAERNFKKNKNNT